MVVQIAPDAGQIEHRLDTMAAQMLCRSDPGQHQNLRTVDRPGRNHDLARRDLPRLTVDAKTHAAHPLAVEQHAFDQRAGLHLEVRPLAHRIEKDARGRRAHPVADHQLDITDAFLRRAVEIVVERDAEVARGLHERLRRRVRLVDRRDAQLTTDAVQVGCAAVMALGALEVRQHVVPAPAGVARIAPGVEVLARAAHVDVAVDAARAADQLASRPGQTAVVQARLGLGLVAPADLRIGHHTRHAGWHLGPDVVMVDSGFEQQHPSRRIG